MPSLPSCLLAAAVAVLPVHASAGPLPSLSIDDAHRREQQGDNVSGEIFVIDAGPAVQVDCSACRLGREPARRLNAVMILNPAGAGFIVRWRDVSKPIRLDAATLMSAFDERRFPGFAAGERWFLTLGHRGGGKKFSYDVLWAGEITVK